MLRKHSLATYIYKCFQPVNFHTQYSQTFNKHIFVNEDCSNNKNAGFYTSNIWYQYTFFYKHMTFGSLGYMCLIHVLNAWAHLSSVPYMCLIYLKKTIPYMCLNQGIFFLSKVTIFHAKRLNFHKNYTS